MPETDRPAVSSDSTRAAPPRALVTGGGSGMGFAMAKRLLDRGASVLICGHEEDVLAKASTELQRGSEVRCQHLTLDLIDPAAPGAAVDACVEAFGGIEVLVNNAGIADFCKFDEMTAESWDRSQNLMARAPMLSIQAAARHMAKAGGGRIVNNASISGSLSEPESAQYSAAKAALISLTRTAAVDLAHLGIRVNAMAPGWIRTGMSAQFLAGLGPDGFAKINPLGRPGEPAEVATVAEFLALDAPDYLTGETIYVDGGQAVFLPLPQQPGAP
jgi:3-oxoacyl-[acyl-carrier protein] reductase